MPDPRDNTDNITNAAAHLTGSGDGGYWRCKSALWFELRRLATKSNVFTELMAVLGRLNGTDTRGWGDPQAFYNLDLPAAGFSCADAYGGDPILPATPDPTLAQQGSTNETLVVTGSGFQEPLVVAIVPAGGVTVDEVSVDSPTQVTITFSVDPAADLGDRSIVLIGPTGVYAVLENVLEVTSSS